MKSIRLASMVAFSVACVSLSGLALAADDPTDIEVAPVEHITTPGPIVINHAFKKAPGSFNLTVNPDGSYVFSGQYANHKPGKDMDIALALKNSKGEMYLFQYVGDAGNGARWSKTGKSTILKDDFAQFQGHSDWSFEYHFAETAKARRQAYEARERKREELHRRYEEAIIKSDRKLAGETKEALAKLDQEEARDAQQRPAAPQAGGNSASDSGGSSSGGLMSTLGTVASSVLSFL